MKKFFRNQEALVRWDKRWSRAVKLFLPDCLEPRFKSAILRKDYRPLARKGYAVSIPTSSPIDISVYLLNGRYKLVRGTSDIVIGAEFNNLAQIFAENFNDLLFTLATHVPSFQYDALASIDWSAIVTKMQKEVDVSNQQDQILTSLVL